MKWFEHGVSDREQLSAKLIKRKFGLEGYGIWNCLIEIIGENIERNNIEEWGYVSKGQTMQSLADNIGCSLEKFKEFVKFCDDNLILEKKNGRLFCADMLNRMSEYARKNGKKEVTEIPEIPEIPEKVENTEISLNNTIQDNTEQDKNINYIGKAQEIEKVKKSHIPRIEKVEKSHIPCYVDCDINSNPEEDHLKLQQEEKCNKFKGIVYHHCGKEIELLEISHNDINIIAQIEPPKGFKTIKDRLGTFDKIIEKNKASPSGISGDWQAQCFYECEKMGIKLDDPKVKGRVLKIYKQAYEEGRKKGNLVSAFSYLADYEGNLDNTEKLNYLFWIYEHGMEKKGFKT